MYADIYNLFPTIGEVNKNRKNFGMSIIKGEKMEFGKCDFEIENNKVEPREEIRGIIARTYFYMDFAYPEKGIVSEKNKNLFEKWDQRYPVDEWECKRAKKIENIQGNQNIFVIQSC